METKRIYSKDSGQRRNRTPSYSTRSDDNSPQYRQRSSRRSRMREAAARTREEHQQINRRDYSTRQRAQRGAVSNYGAQKAASKYYERQASRLYSKDKYTNADYKKSRLSKRREAQVAMQQSQAAYYAQSANNIENGQAAVNTQAKRKKRRGWGFKRILLFALIIAIAAFAAWWFLTHSLSESNQETNNRATFFSNIASNTPTPIMAESDGVKLHCAVGMNELTEILIHNASYTYAKPITTKLTEATNTEVQANHGTGRNAASQPLGDNWMTGEFIRCYRSDSAGSKMSAIDCGGPVNATVYSPVKGKVVKVANYDLYNNKNYPDIQVHIQPEGRSDLDVVLIHLQNVPVKVGDQVEAGETVIGHIRDVYAYIGESMQLKKYTAEGDNGNHTHIQVNDATDPNYQGLSN